VIILLDKSERLYLKLYAKLYFSQSFDMAEETSATEYQYGKEESAPTPDLSFG
jgi:hypothetical protein